MAKPAIAERTYPLVGIFDSGNAAERAYQACLARGYELGQVNVVVSEETRKKLLQSDHEVKAELGTREAEGGELGGPKGGRVGVLVTVLAAVGAAVAVPAIGLVVGPLAIALTAAGAAGVAGGLIAALGNWGVPEDRVRGYEADIRKGAILMSVEAVSAADADAMAAEWQKSGGRDIHRMTAT
jgi:hypothetical protein